MPDLPEEAVRSATQAYLCAWTAGVVKPETLVRIALEAAAPVLDAQARADERRKTAEQVAARIEAEVDPLGLGPGPQETEAWRSGMRLAARLARQIGEARDSR